MHSQGMVNSRLGIPAILLLFSLSSCSLVKENRDSCPCSLVVEVSGLLNKTATLLVTSLRDTGYVERICVARDTVMGLFVPRGGVSISAWSGAEAQDAIKIPFGKESPPIYLYHGVVDTRGDTAYAGVTLHKQFCTLYLEVEGPPGWGPPLGAAVRGSACGMTLSGAILQGPFQCVASGSVRLPRQQPESQLMLDILMEDKTVRTFSLGAYLQKAGYNWTARDLSDITVHMDLSVSAVTFTSPGLTEPVVLTVDI